jgi:transposase
MVTTKQHYDREYKAQALQLAEQLGSVKKAAVELGISVDTLYGWRKAARDGRLYIGSYSPGKTMTLNEEVAQLRRQTREQQRRIKYLEEINEFLTEASAFFAASRRKSVNHLE